MVVGNTTSARSTEQLNHTDRLLINNWLVYSNRWWIMWWLLTPITTFLLSQISLIDLTISYLNNLATECNEKKCMATVVNIYSAWCWQFNFFSPKVTFNEHSGAVMWRSVKLCTHNIVSKMVVYPGSTCDRTS